MKIAPAPYNPREIQPAAADGLRSSIQIFGDLSGIVVNRHTGNLVAGHQRIGSAKKSAEIFRALTERATTGWVENGDGLEFVSTTCGYPGREFESEENRTWLVISGQRMALRIVQWPLDFEKAANVAANSPTISGDFTKELDGLLDEIRAADAELFSALRFEELHFEEPDGGAASASGVEAYTRKIQIPIYEPTGPKPSVSSLVDYSKTAELLGEIETAEISADLKTFLRSAAERHSIFDFRRIAEFYAQSEPEVQRLFEKSALVIIDFDAAIANGFVRFAEKIFTVVDEATEEDEPDAE